MKSWHEIFPSLYAYNPDPNAYPPNIELPGRLSPLTNFFLNVFLNSFKNKNLIVAVPSTILRPIPLLSFLYASLKNNKSVVVVTHRNVSGAHYKNYHLLNDGSGYLFEKIPLGVISSDGVEAKVYLPRATRSIKKKYIQQLKEDFFASAKPKILLYPEDKNISEVIEKIITDEGKFENLNLQISLGLMIFENIDRFIYSTYSAKVFLEWLTPLLDKKVNFIFHFSNPESKFIQMIKEATNSLVIPFGVSLLRSNSELRENSIKYFKEVFRDSWKRAEMELINKYNIDRQHFYENITSIEIAHPLLKAGNIDYHLKIAKKFLAKIDEDRIKNKRLYYIVNNLLFKLLNLVINPCKYKELYKDDFVDWGHYTIPQLLRMFMERLTEEDEKNAIFLRYLLHEIYCIYLELKECRRYGEKGTYSRVAKDYKILELVEEACNHKDGDKLIVATSTPYERNILENDIKKLQKKLQLENGFEIRTIEEINKLVFETSKTILILPGPVRLKYLPILLKPYHKIIILAYEGENYSVANEQIALFFTYSFEREKRLMNYLKEVYDFIGVPKDGLFKDYYERKISEGQSVNEKEPSLNNEEENKDLGFLDRIKDIIKKDTRYSHYKEYEEELTQTENTMAELDKEQDKEEYETTLCYEVSLRRVDETQPIKKLLPAEKTFIYLEKIDGKILDGPPRDLKPGYYIILLDNNERKSLLDLIIEIFDLEKSIDKYLIKIWKEKLIEFIEEHNLSYKEFHELYLQEGGERRYQTLLNWIKGNILAPENSMDLLVVGRVLKNEEIMENYQIIEQEVNNLRNIHRIVGRKLKKIIKEVLKGRIDPTQLSYEEYAIYKKIENGVYEIVDIKVNNNFNVGDKK